MNRRTFNAISLAALMTSLSRVSLAQSNPSANPFPNAPANAGYQYAEINEGQLTTRYGGMATPQVAVDNDTLFQVASCSKTVAALAVLTLVRDGRIELDEPVNQYLERWQLPGRRSASATVAELMSHTSGASVDGFLGYGPEDEIPNLLEILEGRPPANSEAVRTYFRLFGKFKYSGGGTTALQLLIEDTTGMDFADYVKAQVLDPIGAPHATFALHPTAPFAHGYYEDGQMLPGGYRRYPESAAAGLWATASDLARVMQAILKSLDGAPDAIIPVELAQRMVTPVSDESGLGIFVNPGVIMWHDGRNQGFDSLMVADPNTGRIRAAVANRNGAVEGYVREFFSN